MLRRQILSTMFGAFGVAIPHVSLGARSAATGRELHTVLEHLATSADIEQTKVDPFVGYIQTAGHNSVGDGGAASIRTC